MSTLTTAEAAALLGVQPGTLRLWVHRGHLTPVQPGARPLRFDEDALVDAHHRTRSPAWRAATTRAARKWADACAQGEAV